MPFYFHQINSNEMVIIPGLSQRVQLETDMKTIGRHIRNVQSHLFMRMSLTTTEGLEELSKNEGQG